MSERDVVEELAGCKQHAGHVYNAESIVVWQNETIDRAAAEIRRLRDALFKCKQKRNLVETEMKDMHDGHCSARVCASVLRDKADEIRSLRAEVERLRTARITDAFIERAWDRLNDYDQGVHWDNKVWSCVVEAVIDEWRHIAAIDEEQESTNA